MEITKELIEKKRAENPGCKLAKVALKAEDEKSVALEVLVKSPDRKIISEAEKWENTNPGKAKEIYVRNCVLTDVDAVMEMTTCSIRHSLLLLNFSLFRSPK